MSSHTKDPLEKQETSSESSELQSDSEVDEAEENLEHLKLDDNKTKDATKKVSGETKPSDSTNQVLLNEPIAGPSGLQKPRQESTERDLEPESKGLTGLVKDVDENIGDGMADGASDTSSTPSSIQSSTGLPCFRRVHKTFPVAGPSRLPGEPCKDVLRRFFDKSSQQDSSSRRWAYATDSANTSSDISEIRSEIVDNSAEESVYQDAPESFEKDQSPSYVSAVEVQSCETSDTNLSELPDDIFRPPSPASSSASTSTPSTSTDSYEQGHRAYLAQLQREADALGDAISTSSGIGSTDQSELANLRAWNEAGAMGFYRRNPDNPNEEVPDQDGEPSLDQQMQDFDRLFEQEGNREDMEVSEDVIRGCVGRRRQQVEEVIQASGAVKGSPSKRRRSTRCASDPSVAEKGAIEKLKPRFKPDTGKKNRMVASKSTPALHSSSSESTEPKTSSSDELHRKGSPDIKSVSGAQEFSESDKGRKSWQTSGLLRSRQISTTESVVTEEEDDRTSPVREQEPELMGDKDPTPEKVGTTSVKEGEGAAAYGEPSESKPSISSDQAYGSETEGTLKEQGTSLEFSDFERSVGKSKRESKLSTSPPSDDKLDSSPPKAAASRPKKKAKSEIVPSKTRRTRQDSGGTVPTSISLGDLHQSESSIAHDISDYTPSDDEKETSL